jgi:SAM-dependent methyltransferase
MDLGASETVLAGDLFLSRSQKEPLCALANTLKKCGYEFVTCTPATHDVVNRRAANQWARSCEDIYGWNRPYLFGPDTARWHQLNVAAGIAVPHGQGWVSALRVSTLSGQYFIHSGFPTNRRNDVFFGPDTYRFIRALKAGFKGIAQVRRALDIGCGTAAAAIAIARTFPQAEVLATDLNADALALAEINIALAGARNIVTRHSDLYRDVEGRFDLIVANPPFMNDKEQRSYRHGGGAHGGAISVDIVTGAIKRLEDSGTLLLYSGAAIVQGEDTLLRQLRPLLSRSGLHWSYEELDPDVFGEELERDGYADVDRIAVVLLTVCKKSSEPEPA